MYTTLVLKMGGLSEHQNYKGAKKMTKAIRIENADTSDWEVVVQVWNIHQEGPDALVNEYILKYPTAMLEEYIHGTQYLIIKESTDQHHTY